MQRRQFIQSLAIGGPIAVTGGGYLWLTADRDHSRLGVAATLQNLEQLASGVDKNKT